MRRAFVAALAVVLTIAAGLIALNLAAGEKQLERPLVRLYDTSDPQFARAMGVLLGPPIVEGNRFEALVNGFACQQLSLVVGLELLNRLAAVCDVTRRTGERAHYAFRRRTTWRESRSPGVTRSASAARRSGRC